MGAGVVAFEGERGEGGRALVFAFGFGNPVDDSTGCVKDRDEMWLAADGVDIGHAGRARVEIKPTDDLFGEVVFDRLDPIFAF